MNVKQVQYALALSEKMNFSQVADQLGITQPALSKQIQHLEKELGVKLFDRNHSPLKLTPAGEYFVRNARELVYREEQLRKALEGFQSGENGRLVIGVTPFRSLYLMPQLVKKIRSRYPGVQVSLCEASSAQLRKDAAEGKFDLAIVNMPVDTALLDAIPLEQDTLALAVHKSLAEKLPATQPNQCAEVDFGQLRDMPFVVLSSGQELRQLFDGLCASADIHPTIAAEVIGVTSAWAFAREGVGAALLPLQFAHSQHFDDDMLLYIVKNSPYARQPVVVTRRGQHRSAYADYAIQVLTGQE